MELLSQSGHIAKYYWFTESIPGITPAMIIHVIRPHSAGVAVFPSYAMFFNRKAAKTEYLIFKAKAVRRRYSIEDITQTAFICFTN